MPKRIQRRRTKGWRMPVAAICVTRPTVFGNPFIYEFAVESYEIWLNEKSTPAGEICERICKREGDKFAVDLAYSPGVYFRTPQSALQRIGELRGKNLACFCSLDKPCHADILLELANA